MGSSFSLGNFGTSVMKTKMMKNELGSLCSSQLFQKMAVRFECCIQSKEIEHGIGIPHVPSNELNSMAHFFQALACRKKQTSLLLLWGLSLSG